MSVVDRNRQIFGFFEERADFIETHDGIESWIVWGPVVDALARIHARRLGRRTRFRVGEVFREALVELSKPPGSIDLETVSVPVFADRIRRRLLRHWPDAGLLVGEVPIVEANAARAQRRIWTAAEDRIHTPALKQFVTATRLASLQTLIDGCTYANLLYREFRNPMVHGMVLGWAAWMGNEPVNADGPQYTNRLLGPGQERHVGTPIAFGRPLLVRILRSMIQEEENSCNAAGWAVPEMSTLDEPDH
jgi:hypothetical protein